MPSVARLHGVFIVSATHIPASQRKDVEVLVPVVAHPSA